MKNFIFKINSALAAKTKILSIFAAAVMALSFASCEKTDPGMKFFKLKATVTDTSVVFSATPADTTVYYYLDLYPTSIVRQYTLDSIIASDFGWVQYEYENGYTLDDLLFKGPWGPQEYTGLPANYSITFYAFEVLENNGELSIGRVASKVVSTKKIDVVNTVDLGELVDGELYDYSDYGAYMIVGANETAELGLAIYDNDFKGSYTYADIEPNAGGVWTVDDGYQRIVDAKFTTTYKESDKTGKANGWVVGENGIKYKFSMEYVLTEELPAPARIAKKDFFKEEERQPKTLTLKRYRK